MTLTIKTAKHGIDRDDEVIRIVDRLDDTTPYSLTRDEAEDVSEYDPDFKPCIVVTTAREALEAAWELAHVPEDGIIPARRMHLRRNREDGRIFMSCASADVEATNSYSERRLLDPPAPMPEPWELSTYCYANGHIYERIGGTGTVCWVRPGSEVRYYREYFAKFNPKPVTIEGETE